ncbi:MAG: hypothetical protein JO056_05565 [Alphaproteobacteria bacterium]|nr:hypothetical protein [Alphaproteobacteria bacterium]
MAPVRPVLAHCTDQTVASFEPVRSPSVGHGRASTLHSLERAIYSTLAYRDIFQFPLTASEIHRYLHGRTASQDEVAVRIATGLLRRNYLDSDGLYFALRGRGDLFPIRHARTKMSAQQRPTALRMARFLANLPNVRMVALTGSLAAGNFSAGADIDFLLLTDAGTMWRTRALCRVFALANKNFGNGLFCPNMFLSAAQGKLNRQSLYDAQELCQMIPLYGLAQYEAVRRMNAWTNIHLPNAEGAPENTDACVPFAPGLKRLAEGVLDSPLGRSIESFEARRKIHRFNNTGRLKGAWTRSTLESHSLWDDMRLRIEAAWKVRMEAIAER